METVETVDATQSFQITSCLKFSLVSFSLKFVFRVICLVHFEPAISAVHQPTAHNFY